MLRSLARIYGDRLLTIILTGMGCDGLKGCEAVVNAGGRVMAQDRETSVVWGMPGAVAQAGLCRDVLPLRQIGSALKRIAGGETNERA
jgi:two-component system chemotaxis response regulator CheB